MPWLALTAFGCPLLICGALTALLIRCAPQLGLVDQPNARKVHTRPVPRGGGVCIYTAIALTISFLPGVSKEGMPLFLGVGFGIMLLGLVDDLRPLPWQLRLTGHLLAAVSAVYGGTGDLSWLAKAAAVFWVTGLINAFNMLDNMDALSGGVAWIAAALLGLVSLIRQEPPWDVQAALPYLTFMGSLSGFLWFNRPPARIFMGDAGSTFLGFFLGVRSLDGVTRQTGEMQSWVAPLCILALPWYDMASVVVLRLRQGHSPFHADKQHLSHRLVALGLTSPSAVRVIYMLALASGAAGLVSCQTTTDIQVLILLQLACWWGAIAAIEYLGKFRASGIS
jgi:UDP-GlcNAc:undecaprenyl-phosphate GlcNAc-1-phosphate transferase